MFVGVCDNDDDGDDSNEDVISLFLYLINELLSSSFALSSLSLFCVIIILSIKCITPFEIKMFDFKIFALLMNIWFEPVSS